MNVLAALEGSSWKQCEDIDLKDLEAENGLDVLLRRLDSKWKYDERVELSWDPYLTPSSSRFSGSPTHPSLSMSPIFTKLCVMFRD